MKNARWGLLLSVLGGVVLFAGCQSPIKVLSRGEFDRLKSAERLNNDQARLITALTNDKERLKGELEAAKSLLGANVELLDAMRKQAQLMEKDLTDRTASMPVEVSGGAKVIQTVYGPGFSMDADLLFAAGSADLKANGEKVLTEIAGIIKEKANDVAVWGYTDSDPIKHSHWKSNFELSGARALAVLEHLRKQGVEPSRMHFAGFGEYSLKYSDGKENKKTSRRAEIILLNQPMQSSEAPAPAAGSVVIPK